MKKKIYKARAGAQFNDEQAQVYGPHIEVLYEKNNGKLKPKEVVDDARNKKSPIHPFFEWDDTIAGEKFRKVQARHLMGNIITVVVINNKEEEVKANYSIVFENKDEDKRAYFPLETVMTNDEYRKEIVKSALEEVRGWQERYKIYSELSAIFKVINKVYKKENGKNKKSE